MGFLGAIAGYVGGKTAVATATLGVYTLAATASLSAPFFPPAAAAAGVLWTTGNAMGGMVVSPVDPVTTATMAASTVATGPV